MSRKRVETITESRKAAALWAATHVAADIGLIDRDDGNGGIPAYQADAIERVVDAYLSTIARFEADVIPSTFRESETPE